MDYYVLRLRHHLEQVAEDLLVDDLAALGFESFETEEGRLAAYIPAKAYGEKRQEIDGLLAGLSAIESRHEELIPDQDWNAVWESQYEPVRFGDFCFVHAPFHQALPEVEYNVEIEPKMSFGTAHHPTTALMIKFLEENPPQGEAVLDMGCGTAVLGILAAMQGARSVYAIDIDEWAYRNAVENAARNGFSPESYPHGRVRNLGEVPDSSFVDSPSPASRTPFSAGKACFRVFEGDAALLEGGVFDRILANINRNILLRDIERYSACLQKGGLLYLSGFYLQDMAMIEQECNARRLFYRRHLAEESWVAMEFIKK